MSTAGLDDEDEDDGPRYKVAKTSAKAPAAAPAAAEQQPVLNPDGSFELGLGGNKRLTVSVWNGERLGFLGG